MHGETVRC